MPETPEQLARQQIEVVTGLERSFAEDCLRALIQMATSTARSFTYRLIKHAKANRVFFLVDHAM